MTNVTGLAEAMSGLDGFRVLEVVEDPDELVITIETTMVVVGCVRCGTGRRRPVDVRDLACFGRPVRLRVLKRRWRCVEPSCAAKTWTEQHPGLPLRQVMTSRAGFEAARQVGELARPVSQVADEFGVCWDTIMAAVEHHGRPLVDDPNRVGQVEQLGVDETSLLNATRTHPTVYATGLVDTSRGILIDMGEGDAIHRDVRRAGSRRGDRARIARRPGRRTARAGGRWPRTGRDGLSGSAHPRGRRRTRHP